MDFLSEKMSKIHGHKTPNSMKFNKIFLTVYLCNFVHIKKHNFGLSFYIYQRFHHFIYAYCDHYIFFFILNGGYEGFDQRQT